MNRHFLFMSGEPSVSTTLAFSNPNWEHTSVPTKLIKSDLNSVRRENRINEVLFGLIHYADVDDKSIEINNINLIINNNIPCWPNPNSLLRMVNRHAVLKECSDFGLLTHKICQSDKFTFQMKFPFVLKIGTQHRGINKFLISSVQDLPKWDGIATMEPFFEGDSVRILKIGSEVFSFRITNDFSWIKNSPGAEIDIYNPSDELVQHALDCAKYFNLDVAGVDYIVENDGNFHFLEINQYPGLGVFEEIEEVGRRFIKQKMHEVENTANYRSIYK